MTSAVTQGPILVIQDGDQYWRFTEPVEIVTTRRPDEVEQALVRIEHAVTERGLYAAGYLAYEAAAAYGLATHAADADEPPLLWFGLFRERAPITLPVANRPFTFGDWTASISEDDYHAGVAAVKEAIAAGNAYQANLTFNLRAPFRGAPWSLFVALCRAQRARYTAYLDLGRHIICSASPELFFRRKGRQVVSRPMKGTAQRGLSSVEDESQAEWLRNSAKNRAENVMIVDMIRNDLGRVAAVGSVRVPELFTVERYPTLLQMTSTVTAETDATLAELMRAAFPCASITGAPKVRTMSLLRDLEQEPRGIYTGSVGMLTPDGQTQFSVAIRTVLIDRQAGTARYGVGSGIVWDSEPAAEYAECLLKARVLETSADIVPDFSLLESLRWTPEEGYWLLDEHVDRLMGSATYFDIPITRGEVAGRLLQFSAALASPVKVRLLVAQDGQLTVEAVPLGSGQLPTPVRLGLALEPVSSRDRWLYHKTTVRAVYELARAGRPECDDVALFNEHGEVTETSTANLIVELDGSHYTPPVASGLLAGTARHDLLARGELTERIITVEELVHVRRLWTLNSVRGLLPAVLVDVGQS